MTTNDCGAKGCFEREVAQKAALTIPYTVAAWQPICHALWAHGYSKTEALEVVGCGLAPYWVARLLDGGLFRKPGWMDEAGSPMTALGRSIR